MVSMLCEAASQIGLRISYLEFKSKMKLLSIKARETQNEMKFLFNLIISYAHNIILTLGL